MSNWLGSGTDDWCTDTKQNRFNFSNHSLELVRWVSQLKMILIIKILRISCDLIAESSRLTNKTKTHHNHHAWCQGSQWHFFLQCNHHDQPTNVPYPRHSSSISVTPNLNSMFCLKIKQMVSCFGFKAL